MILKKMVNLLFSNLKPNISKSTLPVLFLYVILDPFYTLGTLNPSIDFTSGYKKVLH